jgi:RNA polymerase sigma factor (sigma-70 family)
MEVDPNPSVSQWIAGAKDGDSQAFQRLWHHYFEALVHRARRYLTGRRPRGFDEEDVALSVFAGFCRAVTEGRFPDVTGRDHLWRLLLKMTADKAVDKLRSEDRQKRGGHTHVDQMTSDALEQLVGDSPTPAFVALVAEQCDRLLGSLDDDLRVVAVAKMEGCTNKEIAGQLDCSVSTIERKLALVRKIWKEHDDRARS